MDYTAQEKHHAKCGYAGKSQRHNAKQNKSDIKE